MAPVIAALRKQPERFEPLVITTSQHREMLAQAMHAFQLSVDIDLGLTHANQTLAELVRLGDTMRGVLLRRGLRDHIPPP